jgi:hypothetical protein
MNRIGILLIAVALIAGMASYAACPIKIRTWYDLNAIRNNLGADYILMNDRNSTTAGYEELASPTANGEKGWQPIGVYTATRYTGLMDTGTNYTGLMGTFEGQGHEVRDLFIDRPDESYVGLFGRIGSAGVIEDIGVVNFTVIGENLVGGLVGENDGAASNSYATGSVIGDAAVGGLVGFSNSGTVSNSYSTGGVTGSSSVGGLVGVVFFGAVINSYSIGSVTGQSYVGGLVGHSVRGEVSNSHSTGDVTGNLSVGGLVGNNELSGTVNNSYSSSSVTGNNCTGGLVAANAGAVSNSYATGSVTGDAAAGGLVGVNIGDVTMCYCTSNVIGSYSTGGLVGENSFEWSPLLEGTVSNSFWDTQTSGQSSSTGGKGETTAEMHDITTFSDVGWNITAVANPSTFDSASIWNIVDGMTYPFLSG